MTELAERARRDFEIRVELKAQFDEERRAALPAERKEKLRLTDERYRQHREWMKERQARERAQLEEGIAYFSTLPLDILEAFLSDLNQDGPFAKAHGLESGLGMPGFLPPTYKHGLQGFISTYRHYYSDDRYIRDFLNFRPSNREMIRLTWECLKLEAPTGLTEIAEHAYSRAGIRRLLIVSLALQSTQYEYATRNLQTTGYARGDEIADRTQHLKWMSPGLARYILEQNPDDQTVARKLTGPAKDLFSLTLEGVSQARLLHFLERYASSAHP